MFSNLYFTASWMANLKISSNFSRCLSTNCSLPSNSTLPSLTFILNFASGTLNVESVRYVFYMSYG